MFGLQSTVVDEAGEGYPSSILGLGTMLERESEGTTFISSPSREHARKVFTECLSVGSNTTYFDASPSSWVPLSCWSRSLHVEPVYTFSLEFARTHWYWCHPLKGVQGFRWLHVQPQLISRCDGLHRQRLSMEVATAHLTGTNYANITDWLRSTCLRLASGFTFTGHSYRLQCSLLLCKT